MSSNELAELPMIMDRQTNIRRCSSNKTIATMNEFFNREDEKNKRRQLRRSMPEAEVMLWSRLKGRQLLGCKFRRQYSVGTFVLDFYSAEIKLGIELDGDSHFQSGVREYDQNRQHFIESFGIKITRILNTEIYQNLDGVLEMVGREVLMRREQTGG
jgi:very-short-patch-repair endonuclease